MASPLSDEMVNFMLVAAYRETLPPHLPSRAQLIALLEEVKVIRVGSSAIIPPAPPRPFTLRHPSDQSFGRYEGWMEAVEVFKGIEAQIRADEQRLVLEEINKAVTDKVGDASG